MNRNLFVVLSSLVSIGAANADERRLPLVDQVPAQPLWAQVQRVVEAMDYLGHPFSDATKAALDKASKAYVGPLTEVRASPGPFADVCHHAERQNDFRPVHSESDV